MAKEHLGFGARQPQHSSARPAQSSVQSQRKSAPPARGAQQSQNRSAAPGRGNFHGQSQNKPGMRTTQPEASRMTGRKSAQPKGAVKTVGKVSKLAHGKMDNGTNEKPPAQAGRYLKAIRRADTALDSVIPDED